VKYRKIVLGITVFISSICLGALLYNSVIFKIQGSYQEIDWYKLAEHDFVSGMTPDALKILDGQKVKIPGFMVPLEDNMRKATVFLLVPSPQACIHVPPPPPNQMVFAESISSQGLEIKMYVPIWVYGIFHIVKKKHQFGESSFEIKVETVENYQ
jgi:hypothetical protein